MTPSSQVLCVEYSMPRLVSMRLVGPVFVSSILFLAGCLDLASIHEREAKAFCEIYSASSWEDVSSSSTRDELNEELASRIAAAIESDEFRAIFTGLVDGYVPDSAQYIRDGISKMLGHEWDCPEFKGLYVVPVFTQEGLGGESSPPSSVEAAGLPVNITADGTVLIGEQGLSSQDQDAIAAAISERLDDSDQIVVIYVTSDSPHAAVQTVMRAAAGLGVEKLSIIEK